MALCTKLYKIQCSFWLVLELNDPDEADEAISTVLREGEAVRDLVDCANITIGAPIGVSKLEYVPDGWVDWAPYDSEGEIGVLTCNDLLGSSGAISTATKIFNLLKNNNTRCAILERVQDMIDDN